MTKTIDAPARGRKWDKGVFVRDGITLYRVTGAPVQYHEDCVPVQTVTAVKQPPADWAAAVRLVSIMEAICSTGTHLPQSSGGNNKPTAEPPASAPDTVLVSWDARQESGSYASFPRLTVRGDLLGYCAPQYDDAPVMAWIQDAALADEARALIAMRPSLAHYPRVTVRVR